MKGQPITSRNPWVFIPTLYFAEGLPYIIVNTVSVILYKKMGIDNASIAFWTSWLYLPW
ncbi:MAG: AmpG family muropeptide MFS transporter, partial [Nitrospirae bacterium]|nr:AmpG family muropeptide MFS transporter [Nitrospirota bacterium]